MELIYISLHSWIPKIVTQYNMENSKTDSVMSSK